MKLIIFSLISLLLAGCTSHNKDTTRPDEIILLQTIWNSKDPAIALKQIQGLHKTEENDEDEIFTIDKKNTVFSLAIYVSKNDQKIFYIKAPINKGNESPSSLIKLKLKTDDWKTYEHPMNGTDYVKSDVTEYSEKLGAAFVYDKFDQDKKVRMIYWGGDPKKLQTIL